MTPARPLAVSAIALGFASSLTTPTPAFAAPAPCERAQNYAAQSGAEMLRIDQLTRRTTGDPSARKPRSSASPSSSSGSSGRSRGRTESATDTAAGLLGPDSGLADGDLRDSGEGVTGFLSGTGDLLKSITNGGVTAAGGPLSAAGGGGGPLGSASGGSSPLGAAGSGGQGGGGPVEETSAGPSSASIAGVGLGETKTAMIADARTNAVAVGRILDGDGPLGKPLIQSAPPNAADAKRHTPSGSAGPLDFSAGDLVEHAAWDAAMACGNATGEAAHSSATLKHADLLDGNLLHASNNLTSLSSTSMSRDGSEPRSVAAATIGAGKLTLANGTIKLQVLAPPTLTASMGTTTGGQVTYQPPKVKVTWPGGKSQTLTTAGDSVDISLGADEHSAESAPLGGLPKLDSVLPTSAIPLPAIPDLPTLATPDTESAPAAANGFTVRISLGDVRRATKAHAIAAKASAIKIAISEGCASDNTDGHGTSNGNDASHNHGTSHGNGNGNGRSDGNGTSDSRGSSDSHGKSDGDSTSDGRGKDGYGDASSAIVAQMSLGLLEAAVVAPEAAQNNGGGGAAAALPITGPQAGLIAVGGLGLLAAGGAAVLAGRRRRRSLP